MGSSWFGRGVWFTSLRVDVDSKFCFFQWSLRELCGTAAALAPQPVLFSDGQPWSERTPQWVDDFSTIVKKSAHSSALVDVFVGFRLGFMTSSQVSLITIAGEVRASGSASAIEAGWMGLGCYSTASWPWKSLNGNGPKNERAIFHGDELPEGIESMASSGALTRGVCSA